MLKIKVMKKSNFLLLLLFCCFTSISYAQRWGIAGFGVGFENHSITNTSRFLPFQQDSGYVNLANTQYTNSFISAQGDLFKEHLYFSYDFGFSLKRSYLTYDGPISSSTFSEVYRRFLKLDLGWGNWKGEGVGWWFGLKYEAEAISQSMQGGTYFHTEDYTTNELGKGYVITQSYFGWKGIGIFARGMSSFMDNHLMIHGSLSVFPLNTIGSGKREYGTFGKMAFSPELSVNYLFGKGRNWGLGLSAYTLKRAADEEQPEEHDAEEVYVMPAQVWKSTSVELKLFMGIGNAEKYEVRVY